MFYTSADLLRLVPITKIMPAKSFAISLLPKSVVVKAVKGLVPLHCYCHRYTNSGTNSKKSSDAMKYLLSYPFTCGGWI